MLLRNREIKSLRSKAAGMIMLLCLACHGQVSADVSDGDRLAAGKKLAEARDKGNCLACHAFDDGELPGTIGPPLVHMKLRFPDKAALRAQIWDPTARNPDTLMPPFGKHGILSEQEIDLVVDYIQTL